MKRKGDEGDEADRRIFAKKLFLDTGCDRGMESALYEYFDGWQKWIPHFVR